MASLKTRLGGAVVIGVLPLFVLGPGVVIMFSAAGPKDEDMMILIGLVVLFMGLVLLLATQINLLTRDGQTVGKRAVGSRIVSREDGSNPGFIRAVLLRSGVPF